MTYPSHKAREWVDELALKPDRCSYVWLIRQKSMTMYKWEKKKSKRMKVASGVGSLWEQFSMAFAHQIAQNSHCGHCYQV